MLITGQCALADNVDEFCHNDRAYEERLFCRDAQRIQSLVQYRRTCIGCDPPLEDLKRHYYQVYAWILHFGCSISSCRAMKVLPQGTWRHPRSAFLLKLKAGLLG